MNVFELRKRLIEDYGDFVRGFFHIQDDRIREKVEEELQAGLLWPEPLIQLNPSFEPGAWIDELVDQGVLYDECRKIFRKDKRASESAESGKPLRLHKHQSEAVEVAQTGHHYVLTTGTGSGKSLVYIIPIVDHVLRHGSARGRGQTWRCWCVEPARHSALKSYNVWVLPLPWLEGERTTCNVLRSLVLHP